MVKSILKSKFLVILIGLFVIVLSFYLLREFFASREKYTESYLQEEDYIMVPKVYGVNEYSVTEISDQDMTMIYLNDYIYNVNNNIETAYNLLNEEYRLKKFGDIEGYKNYIDSINYAVTLSSYSLSSKAGNDIYTAYDKNGNMYIFKTNGVMQYEVYLDDYTVEI